MRQVIPPASYPVTRNVFPRDPRTGEVMLADLQQHGYDVTEDVEAADAVIINTCAFIDQAKKESVTCIQDAAQLQVPLLDFDVDSDGPGSSDINADVISATSHDADSSKVSTTVGFTIPSHGDDVSLPESADIRNDTHVGVSAPGLSAAAT